MECWVNSITPITKSMSRKVFRLALGAMLYALCVPAEAQQQAKVHKIGWLGNRPASGPGSGPEVIRRELRALGYVEGKNIAFEHRYTEGKLERLPALSDELVRLKVDVILTGTTPGARAAKNATRTIPIVFWTEGDPVVAGLVDSLAHPGRNITGFTTISPVIAGKRLELLKESIPSSPASLCCGLLDSLNNHGKKANLLRENWVYKFIPWS